MKQAGLRGYYTRSQLARGEVPATEFGRKYANSFTSAGGWYVLGVAAPFTVGGSGGTDHATPYSYDVHVPLALYGIPFQSGIYRTSVEPVDLAPTLASLLGINAPAASTGRVLMEALANSPHHTPTAGSEHKTPKSRSDDVPSRPAGGPQ